MRKLSRRKALKAAGVTGLAVSGMGLASARGDSDVKKKLAELRRATAKYHDLEEAEDDGYALSGHCVSHPQRDAAMGFHAGNFGKVGFELDHTDPQVLVYEKRGNKLHLVAVEFLVVSEEQPTFLGHKMHEFIPADDNPPGDDPIETPEGPVPNPPGDDAIWALHAWVWKTNPDGTFADFNPNVSCPTEEEGDHEH